MPKVGYLYYCLHSVPFWWTSHFEWFFKKFIISEIAFVLSLLTIFSNAPFAKAKEALRVVYFQDYAAVLMMWWAITEWLISGREEGN